MALVVLGSAKGSPGVTTTAIALGAVWPRPAVVADLDPAAGDLTVRYRRGDGRLLDADVGLLSLGAAVRRHDAANSGGDLAPHLQTVAGGLPVLAGLSSPEQVTGLGQVWPAIAQSLRLTPQDVLADCGRLLPGSPTMPVVVSADAVILVARATLDGLYHLRERLRWLAQPLRLAVPDAVPVGVVLVLSDRDRRSQPDVARLLGHAGLPVPVLGRIADDGRAARALGGQSRQRIGRSLLVRSAREVATAVDDLLRSRTHEPAPSMADRYAGQA
jgi:cellulose biosynthesis protein BcsQ